MRPTSIYFLYLLFVNFLSIICLFILYRQSYKKYTYLRFIMWLRVVFFVRPYFSKVNGQKWLLSGIILGGLIDLIILIMGPLVSDTVNSYIQYALIPIFCVFGAFLGKKRVKQRKHSRHR